MSKSPNNGQMRAGQEPKMCFSLTSKALGEPLRRQLSSTFYLLLLNASYVFYLILTRKVLEQKSKFYKTSGFGQISNVHLTFEADTSFC